MRPFDGVDGHDVIRHDTGCSILLPVLEISLMYSDRESAARERDRPRGDERFLDRGDAHNQRRRAYERKSRIFKRNRARAVPTAEQRVVQILLELNNVLPSSPRRLEGIPAEEPRRQRATPFGSRPAAAGVHGQSQRDGNALPWNVALESRRDRCTNAWWTAWSSCHQGRPITHL